MTVSAKITNSFKEHFNSHRKSLLVITQDGKTLLRRCLICYYTQCEQTKCFYLTETGNF